MDSYNLKPIQIDILGLLYRLRFLNSIQLSKLLNQTIRHTNYHLQVLTNKNYIAKQYSRSLGSANLPAVYYLTSGSIKFFEVLPEFGKRTAKRIYSEKSRSGQFIAHCVFVADFYLYLLKDSSIRESELYFFTKTDLQTHQYLLHPFPDAYIVRKEKNGEVKRYFLEVVEDSSPRFALRKRIQQYCDYIDTEKFTESTGHSFPNILFICPSFASLIYLKKHISRIYEDAPLDQVGIYVATREQAVNGTWEKVETEEV